MTLPTRETGLDFEAALKVPRKLVEAAILHVLPQGSADLLCEVLGCFTIAERTMIHEVLYDLHHRKLVRTIPPLNTLHRILYRGTRTV